MKKRLLFVILVITAVSMLTAETKLSMKIWNRYSMEMIDGETTENAFSVSRGYFRLEPDFGHGFKGRFNLDFFSDDINDGAGIKLKYAYLDYSKLPISDSKVSIGLTKSYFGSIYTWEYPTIDKDPSDKYKFISSTDYGVAWTGNFPMGYGEYAVGVYNGEGYKKTGGDLNTTMAYLANVRVIPITGLMVGGSFYSKTNGSEANDDETDYTALAGLAQFSYSKFSVLGEYLSKDDDDVTSTAMMVMPSFRLNNNFELIGRYDIFDCDTDNDDVYGGKVSNSDNSSYLVGANWYISKTAKQSPILTLKANYQNTSFELEDTDPISTVMLQLEWNFSHKIK